MVHRRNMSPHASRTMMPGRCVPVASTFQVRSCHIIVVVCSIKNSVDINTVILPDGDTRGRAA
jgi:hypothetical protein